MTDAPPALDRTLNPRVEAVRPSATLAVSARAKALARAGRDVVALSAGEPDFDTPAPIVEAAHAALDAGFTHYTANPGIPELREAIAEKLRRENGVPAEADHVVCSNGAKQSVAQAVLALCAPGDEVLIPAPYWVSYPEMARLAGAEPVTVASGPETGYRLTPEALKGALTERTRVVLLNQPGNPTGAVYTRPELQALADALKDHPRAIVVSDEIYEYVRYEGEHVAFASLDGMAERTVTVNGFSKGYAMTGWRLGYLAAPGWIADATAKIQSQLTSAPSSITQKAGLAALRMDPAPIREMVAAFERRRDYVLGRLEAIPGLQCPTPQGAFYVFPDVSAYFGRTTPGGDHVGSSSALCLYLLDEHGLALVPGEAFGAPAGVRLSYASDLKTLETALDRLEAGLEALKG